MSHLLDNKYNFKIFWSCQIMRDLQAEQEVSTKRQKTSCTSVSSPFNANPLSEASVSVPRALSFSNTSACSSTVTAALRTTEGNVMPASPSETDEFSFQDNPSAPPPPAQTSTPRPKCTRCVQNRKKRQALRKEHNRLKKRFIKLQENFKLLQAVEVIFSFTISFKFLKYMKFY